jgi:hypothetical protein
MYVPHLDGWELVFVFAIFLFLGWTIVGRVALAAGLLSQRRDASRDMITLLRQVAHRMSRQPPQQEAKWITYLLETLGNRLDRDTYRQVLEGVERDIAERLEASRS